MHNPPGMAPLRLNLTVLSKILGSKGRSETYGKEYHPVNE